MASAIRDRRHPSYIDHSLTDLLRQRILQTACGYADGNDANSLRHDPVFKLATERAPLDADNALASGPTFSRLENGIYRKDIYCLAQAFVDAFIASYAAASAIIGRVVRRLRQAWPDTHIVLRGDGHFANPELMALCRDDDQLDFIFGLAGNKVLTPKAEPLLEKARALHAERGERARQQNHKPHRQRPGCTTR